MKANDIRSRGDTGVVMPPPRVLVLLLLLAAGLVVLSACTGGKNVLGLSGSVHVDGSSTVYPISEAVAEEFVRDNSKIRVTVGLSGTGGGFSKFCDGELDITDASRPISPREIDLCAAKGIEYIELPVAYDALSVVVNPKNDWVQCITLDELKTMWEPAAQDVVTRWEQVNPAWSAGGGLKLYGPGTDSGTFDYFTERVVGEAKASRADYTPSEDDNVLVQGVAGDRGALGYFGLAFLEQNLGRIKGLEVDDGEGCIEPTAQNVEAGTYPLSRPLFIYVKKEAAERPEVAAFVDFYLENAAFLAADVGYIRFPEPIYAKIRQIWDSRTTGTIFSGETGTVSEVLGID
jgi:phosphate transport system substrate-binding protein